MFGSIVDDGTLLPNASGSIVTSNNIASQTELTYASNSLDASVYVSDFGYHTKTSTHVDLYDLQERHKTYKILDSVMTEYRKHKNQYDINICGGSKTFSVYTLPNEAITIKLNTNLGISFFNNKENKIETIEKISDYASGILQDCVVEFLDKHSEEFMELVVSNVKRDVVQYAKQEGKKIKDQLEFVEIIENMEN